MLADKKNRPAHWEFTRYYRLANTGLLRAHSHDAKAFPIHNFFHCSFVNTVSSQKNTCVNMKTTEADSKRCSIHARPICGIVILPQRYTKNGEEDWEHALKPCTLYTNQTQQQEKLVNPSSQNCLAR